MKVKLTAVVDNAIVTIVPLTGGTVTIPSGISYEIINPAGTLAALTIVTPAAPTNPSTIIQELHIVFTKAITTITWTAGAGTTYGGATKPTSAAIGNVMNFLW